MLDLDELKYTLDRQLEGVETEAEMMRFCSVLLTYANGVCTALAEEDESEEQKEAAENDTYFG